MALHVNEGLSGGSVGILKKKAQMHSGRANEQTRRSIRIVGIAE